MTYRDALWSAIIGEADKFGKTIKNTKMNRYLKLCKYWRKAQ